MMNISDLKDIPAPIESAKSTGEKIVFQLATKHTDCLAKEKCGIESESSCCSAESGCC